MNIIERRLKGFSQKKRINKLKNSLDKNTLIIQEDNFEFIDCLMKDIAKLGLPFFKHRKGTKIYIESAEKLFKIYKKHRSEVIEVFKLGQEYFNNKNFVYRPSRINIADFIRFNSKNLMHNEYAKRFSEDYQVKSLFNEFRKGRKYINSKYLRIKVDEVEDSLMFELIDIWNRFREDIQDSEKLILNQFINTCKQYSSLNVNLSVRSIFYLLENEILSKDHYNINVVGKLNSNYFWNKILPDVIIKFRLYPDKAYLKQIEK